MRLLKWFITVLCVALLVASGTYLATYPANLYNPGFWFGPVFALVFGLAVWIGTRPPVLRVNGGQVTYRTGISQRVARADLASIYRGQAFFRYWLPAYFLVTQDGTPRITILAQNFTDEGMTDLAKRLQVPIQGDFSVQVH